MDATYVCYSRIILFSVLQCFVVAFRHLPDTEPHEICQWESFNATCTEREVVMMTSAQYGRMRLGRCLATEVYIGCSADFLSQLDLRCSGLSACTIAVPDSLLHKQQPCPQDMMAYLEASYTCVPVVRPPKGQKCANSIPIAVANANSGFLASSVTNFYGYGSSSCPWLVRVAPGQRIMFTLYDFTMENRYNFKASKDAAAGSSFCIFYAIILDKGKSQDFTVCAGLERKQEVYTSVGNEVEVQIPQQIEDEPGERLNFLLEFRAVGCPDPVPPPDAAVRRHADKATVSCNYTSEAWHLVCKGDHWVGDYKNCSQKKGTAADLTGDDGQFPSYGLIVAIVIGVSLGIVCGFAMLAAVLLCRKKERTGAKSQLAMNNRGGGGGGCAQTYGVHVTSGGGGGSAGPCKVHRLGQQAPADYGYTHVWEVQQQHAVSTLGRGGGGGQPGHYAAFHECDHGSVPAILYRCKDGNFYGEGGVGGGDGSELTMHRSGGDMPPFYHDHVLASAAVDACSNTPASGRARASSGGDIITSSIKEEHEFNEEDDCRNRELTSFQQNGYRLIPTTPDRDSSLSQQVTADS